MNLSKVTAVHEPDEARAVLHRRIDEALRAQVAQATADLERIIKRFDQSGGGGDQATIFALQDVISNIMKPPLGGVWGSREDAVEILDRLKRLHAVGDRK